LDDLARQAKEAVGKGDLKDLYSITRTLAGVRKITERKITCSSRKQSGDYRSRRAEKKVGRTL